MSKFITIEGIEGAGKSTIIPFIEDWLLKKGFNVITTREPGGTEIAEKIRKVILNHHSEKMCADTELLLFFAARAQHINSLIKPALISGKIVVSDRFTDSSYAYQYAGRGIENDRISILEDWVQDDFRPDITILLDLPPEVGFSRIKKGNPDRIETEMIDFFKMARECYLAMANKFPNRYRVIDASGTFENTKKQLINILKEVTL